MVHERGWKHKKAHGYSSHSIACASSAVSADGWRSSSIGGKNILGRRCIIRPLMGLRVDTITLRHMFIAKLTK